MIQLFNYPDTRGLRVTWMLEELEADYEFNLVPVGNSGFGSEEYIKINPAGKVPAIRDGDLVLTESAAIVTYLGDKFPDKKLVPPAGSAARAKYDQWCYFVLSELEQPLWTKGKHKFMLPRDKRVPAIIETAEWEFQKALKILSQGLDGHRFILGDTFSAADILIGQTLSWARTAKQPVELQNVADYADSILGREALQRARAREAASNNA